MRSIFCLFALLSLLDAHAQPARYTAFTTANGLPGNHVHRCVEDNNGFLWVATEAGVARFDGKYFQVFTTKNGLPDDEVLQLVKEVDGTIWVNCFKHSPAYFDAVQNRFINATENADLAAVSATMATEITALPSGGVMYTNEKGSYTFRNRRLVKSDTTRMLKENTDGSVIYWERRVHPGTRNFYLILIQSLNGRNIDSATINFPVSLNLTVLVADNKIFISGNEGKSYVLSGIATHPLRFQIDSLRIPGSYFASGITRSHFYVLTDAAEILVYDQSSLQLIHRISGDFLPNSFYEDQKGNIWIGTIDRGLLVYRKEQLQQVDLPAGYRRTNFISIARKPGGTVYAGNYYGEVVEADGKSVRIHTIVRKTPSRQRKILFTGNDIYTISEDGVFKNYVQPVLNSLIPALRLSGKTGVVMNDSTILLGTFSGLIRLDSRNGTENERIRYKRVTAMAKANDSIIYFGSTDGLYQFNNATSVFTPLAPYNPLFTEKVMALCITPDGLLWVATSGKGAIVVKNNQVIGNITSANGILSDASRSIAPGSAGQVWLGSSRGISIIYYTAKDHNISCTVRNISENDGLAGNEVNEMVCSNDTMFIATGNGISVVPTNVKTTGFVIPVRLTKISVNQHDIMIASGYELDYRQNDIQMQFAGIDLNGHFRNLQYMIGNSRRWTDLNGNTLNLQLPSGDHLLHVRALDVNGNASAEILTLQFEIATPFWKSLWFWAVITLLAQGGLLYFISRSQKKRKEAKLAKEIAVVQTAALEQQAFTSLMSPHFIFNALNSIQHYINVQDRQNANRYLSDFASLIRKNFEAAQRSFIPLDQELENLRIYLRLEQMRFADRFSYEINIDDKVDTDEWMIPTMILQPLLENALLHGIMPSKQKGRLVADIQASSDALSITITDNGIGIQNSRALNGQPGHTSHGMDLINKRITALGRFTTRPIYIGVAPAFTDVHNPGNRVTVVIPAGLYESWRAARAGQ